MEIAYDFSDTRLLLIMSGELDHHAARSAMRMIGEMIDAYLPRDCVLDLSGLAFMDSSGIAVILRTYKRMLEIGGRVSVENVPPQPMRVLDASGIDRLIRITT